MTLKLVLALFSLYNKLTTLKSEDFRMGWKTITGAVIMGLGYACKALATVNPIFDTIGDALIAVGITLSGVGIRSAIANK